ncbi:MAG: type II secretion system protein [Candidatus Taylorbacteria bacterium]
MKITKNRAFTLVELLVVISLVSMLASVVLATVNPIRAQARDSKRVQEVRQIDLAVQQYIADNNGIPPEWGGCKYQVDTLDTSSVSGCIAVSTAGVNTDGKVAWNNFTATISKYMPNVPNDPCIGGSCVAANGTPLGYTYIPPAAVKYYCSLGNGCTSGSTGSTNYQLSAALESGKMGGGSTGSPVEPSLLSAPQITLSPSTPTTGQSVTVSWSNASAVNSCSFEADQSSGFIANNGKVNTSGSFTATAGSSGQITLRCYKGTNLDGASVTNQVSFTSTAPVVPTLRLYVNGNLVTSGTYVNAIVGDTFYWEGTGFGSTYNEQLCHYYYTGTSAWKGDSLHNTPVEFGGNLSSLKLARGGSAGFNLTCNYSGNLYIVTAMIR